jgi:hypothetical protein
MSNKKPLTTLQIEKQTRNMLREIAQVYERSMAAQIRVMVRAEYTQLQNQELIPKNSLHLEQSVRSKPEA